MLQEGCHSIIVGASCDRTAAAICFSAFPQMEKNAASAWLLRTGSKLSMSPPHFPGLAPLEERAISVISLKQECFYSRRFLTPKWREGGICNNDKSQLSPTQEIYLQDVSLSSLPSTSLFSETSVKLSRACLVITGSSS